MATRKVAAKARGRPSVFSEAIAHEICRRLAEGESLRRICKAVTMPAESTVRAWAVDDIRGFSAQYERARAIGYDRLAEDLLEIADTPQLGVKTVEKLTGTETTTGDMIEHRRLRIDVRKWLLSKMLPKRYGDKGDDGPTLTPEQIAAAMRAEMAKAGAEV